MHRRAMAVGPEKEGRLAVLIEREVSNPPALARSRDGHHLTPREQETVSLLARGFTNKEIAARMGVSVNTVKSFIRSVMLRLGVSTRTGIVGRLFEGATASPAADH